MWTLPWAVDSMVLGGRGSMRQPEQRVRFCQQCGAKLSLREIEGMRRPYCERCDAAVFFDPKLAAVVLADVEGKLVMVKRGVEPQMGRWAFPSGYVDRGESVESAARREVWEETGLIVEIARLLGVYSDDGRDVVLVAFAARVNGGEMRPGHDAQDVRLSAPHELTDLPFPHDAEILRDWQAATGGASA